MKITVLHKVFYAFNLFLLLVMLGTTYAVAAESPTLLQAKNEAEAKGYVFVASHDEIVAMAKKEGNAAFAMRYWPVLTGWANYLRDRRHDQRTSSAP
jgi:hypothetical protein